MKQRIYLIGTGVIAHHHAAASAHLSEDVQIFAADPNVNARQAFQTAFPDAVVFPSSDEMLAHAAALTNDIVVVATPPRFHAIESLKALRSGRNVLCEKPFAMTIEEAELMVAEAKKLGLHIACCSSRFLEWEGQVKAKELLSEGAIGQPYMLDFIHREPCSRTGVEYQRGSWWFLDISKSGGGQLMDWGPYDIACLVDLLEPETVSILDASVRSIPVRYGVPDGVVFDIDTHVAATLRFQRKTGEAVSVRYERGGCLHGEAFSTEGVYGEEGHLKWHWLPFQANSRVAVFRTKAPGLRDEVVHPVENFTDGDWWHYVPLLGFDRFLRGDPTACALVNDRALQNFSVLRKCYDVAASGQPATVSFQ